MKKYLLLIPLVVLVSAVTTFAAVSSFTDEGEFGDWFKDEVRNMKNYGVVTGYPDGSFQPGNNVTRAELAVMLDRFRTNVVEVRINQNNTTTLNKLLYNMDRFEGAEYDYKNMVVLAESGVGLIENHDAAYLSNLMSGEEFLNEVPNLPEGYELFVGGTIVFDFFLHYEGPRLDGDVEFEVEEWYGPF